MRNYTALSMIPAAVAVLCVAAAMWLIWNNTNNTNISADDRVAPVIRTSPAPAPAPDPALRLGGRPRTSRVFGRFPFPSSLLSPQQERTLEEDRHLKPPQNTKTLSVYPRFPEWNSPTCETEMIPKPGPRDSQNLSCGIPTANHEQTTRVRKYAFSSEDRDVVAYPTSAHYRVKLPTLLRNVIAVSLQTAIIPRSEYIVNRYNQHLDIEEGGVVYETSLPVGNYDLEGGATDFVAALQAAIQGTSVALAAYTASRDALTNTLTVDSNGAAFRLLLSSGPNQSTGLWQQTGFPREDTPALAAHTSPGVINLAGAAFIDLYVDEFTSALDGEVARIDLNTTRDVTRYVPLDSGVRRYFWPIGKVNYMTLRFVTTHTSIVDGAVESTRRPYDFNGRQTDVRFEFVYREYRNVLEDEVELDPSI
jgi:hypothetical protein